MDNKYWTIVIGTVLAFTVCHAAAETNSTESVAVAGTNGTDSVSMASTNEANTSCPR